MANRQYTAVSVCPMKLCKQWTAIKQQLQHQQQQQVRLTTNTSNIATRIYCRPALVYLFHVFSGIFKKFYVFKFSPDHSGQRGIMFLSCSRVLPSVRVTTLVNKIFWEWMNQFWCNFPQVVNGGKTIKQSTSGVRRSIVTVTQHRNRSQKSLSAQHLKNYSTNFSQTRQTRITVNAHYCVTTIGCKRSKIT